MRPLHIARFVLATAPLWAAHRSRRSLGRTARGDAPFTLSFLVTNRCGLKCAHCFYHAELAKPSHDELTFDEYERLSASMGDFGVGLFCGGEPFLRRDLADIVNLFRANNALPLAGAATNGQGTRSILRQTERIVTAHPDKPFDLGFSIDGFEAQHDRIRGHGTFARALRTYRECQSLARHHPNLLLTVTFVINSLNQDRAEDFVSWVARTLEPEAVNVLLVRQNPRAGAHLKQVDPECYRRAQNAALDALTGRSVLRRLSPQALMLSAMADRVYETMLTGKRAFHCHAGRHAALIDYRGEVNVCEVLSEDPATGTIGNLRDFDMSFPALWSSARAEQMRSRVNCHAFCRGCTHETVGLLPSLPFAPNSLGRLLTGGFRATVRRREPDSCEMRPAGCGP